MLGMAVLRSEWQHLKCVGDVPTSVRERHASYRGLLAGAAVLLPLLIGGAGRALHAQSGPQRPPPTIQLGGSWRWLEMWHSGNPAAFRDGPGSDAAGPEFTISRSIGGGRFLGAGYHEAEQTDSLRSVVAWGVFLQAAWQTPVHHVLVIPVRERSSLQLGYLHTRAAESGVTTSDQGAEIAVQQGWRVLLVRDLVAIEINWRTGVQILGHGLTGDIGFHIGLSTAWPL